MPDTITLKPTTPARKAQARRPMCYHPCPRMENVLIDSELDLDATGELFERIASNQRRHRSPLDGLQGN